VHLRTGKVRRVDVARRPYAVAIARDGHSAYVAGGGSDGKLYRVDPRSGHLRGTIPLGNHPRGLALHPDGRHALVALNGSATVVVVSLADHKVVRRIATRPFPTSSPSRATASGRW